MVQAAAATCSSGRNLCTCRLPEKHPHLFLPLEQWWLYAEIRLSILKKGSLCMWRELWGSCPCFFPLWELDVHHMKWMNVVVKNLHRPKAGHHWFRTWKQQDKFKHGLNTTLAFTQGLGQISLPVLSLMLPWLLCPRWVVQTHLRVSVWVAGLSLIAFRMYLAHLGHLDQENSLLTWFVSLAFLYPKSCFAEVCCALSNKT